MAQIQPLTAMGLTLQQPNGSIFAPRVAPPTWKPSDFESAYQFAPKPVSPDAYAPVVDAAQYLQKRIDTAPQRNLANALSTGALNAFQNPTAGDGGSLAGTLGGDSGAGGSTALTGLAGTLTPPSGGGGAVSNASAPDAEGFRFGLGTTFATKSDLADFAKNHSLSTGDNGVGAWGDDTTSNVPQVALPPSTLRESGLDPDKARYTPVTLRANDHEINAVVSDKLPDNSKNGSAIDLNPAAAAQLGISDPDNFKGNVSFRINALGNPAPAAAPTTKYYIPAQATPSSTTANGLPTTNFKYTPPPTGRLSVYPPPPAALPATDFRSQLSAAFGMGRLLMNPDGSVGYQAAMPPTPIELAESAAELRLKRAQAQRAEAGLPGSGPIVASKVVDPDTGRTLQYLTPAGQAIPVFNPATQNILKDAVDKGVDPTPYRNADGSIDTNGLQAAVAQRSLANRQETEKATQGFLKAKANLASMEHYASLPPDQRTAAGDTLFAQAAAGVENPDRASTHTDIQGIQGTGGAADHLFTGASGFITKKRNLSDSQITDLLAAARGSVEQRRQTLQQFQQGGAASVASQSVDPAAAMTSAPQATSKTPSADGVPVGKIAVQNGKRYQKQADGTWKEL